MINFSQDQLLEAFAKTPLVVRSYALSEEFNTDMRAIGTKFNLHVDTLGALSQSTSYMLCGLVTPTEILGELVARDIDSQTAKAIIAELNEKIFKPLNEKVKGAPPEEPSEPEDAATLAAPAPIPTPPVRAVLPAPTLVPAPSPEPPVPAPAPAPLPARPSVPTPVPSPRPASAPAPILPGSNVPVPAPRPSAPAAAPTAPTPSAPRPGAQNANRDALHEVLKSYGVDPYRETPE